MFNYALFDLIIYGICFFSFTSWILDKKESNKIKKNIDDVRPKVGMPSKEKIEILLALFSIRCAEISYLYGMLDERQKDAAEGNWLESFIEDELFATEAAKDVFCEVSDKKRLKIKEEAKELVEKHFAYDHYFGSLSNSEIIKLAFIAYHNGVYCSDRLRGIKSYGFFENTIQTLIEEYDLFKSVSSDVFIRPKFYNLSERRKAFRSDENINKLWNMILLALKSSLRLLQSRNDDALDIEKILKEIDALESLEGKLESTLSKKNYKKRYYDTQKDEEIIRKVWESSPFIKLF